MKRILVLVAISPAVDVVEGKQQLFLARFGIDGVAGLNVCAYQLVAPPREEQVLGLHVVVVRATEVQVFQCEELVLRFHFER